MNECFLIGKIVSDIKYNFIIKSQNKAVAEFKIKTLDNNMIEVYGYNEVADNCYSKLKEGDVILINGEIRRVGKIELKAIEYLANFFYESK